MALEIRTKSNTHRVFYLPLEDSQDTYLREMVLAGTVCWIVADGSEGAACIRAYRAMSGETLPNEINSIRGQVCYAGDLANSVLLNIIHS